MPRPKTITDDEVLSRAREVLLKRGATVSTAEIAKHVGLSQATLFQRFGDKNTLLAGALRPEPVDPATVLGPPDEYQELGGKAHLVLLAERLFDAISGVMERLQVVAAAGMQNPELSEMAHEYADANTLISEIEDHLRTLPETRAKAELVTKALLMLVHGAIAQSLHDQKSGRETARTELGKVVRLLAESATGS